MRDKKNLLIFFPFTPVEKNATEVEKLMAHERKLSLYDELIKSLDFKESEHVLQEYLTELERGTMGALGKTIHDNYFTLPPHVCWIIDLKELEYFKVNREAVIAFKGKVKSTREFDELVKFKTEFSHRFSSKKFGL